MQLIDGYMDLHKRAVHMNLTALDFGPHKLTSIVVMHLTVTIVLQLSQFGVGGIHLELTQAINTITFSIQKGDSSITGRQAESAPLFQECYI